MSSLPTPKGIPFTNLNETDKNFKVLLFGDDDHGDENIVSVIFEKVRTYKRNLKRFNE